MNSSNLEENNNLVISNMEIEQEEEEIETNQNQDLFEDTPVFSSQEDRPKVIPLEFQSIEDPKSDFCLGIDEAGRGPVLGPMVYAAAYCLLSEKDSIKRTGFADSKTLSEYQRELLFNKILSSSNFGFVSDPISPEELSRKMLKINKINLNTISHESAANLIRRVLEKGINIKEVFVDTVGPPAKYQAKLLQQFPDLKITVSKKADSIYPIVSAASICAKVIRDHALKNWKFRENAPISTKFGSGYPSDPNTKVWLQNNVDPVFGFPSVLRFSWKTSDEILNSAALPVAWTKYECYEYDQYGQQKLSLKASDRNQRYRFFAENNMEVVTEW